MVANIAAPAADAVCRMKRLRERLPGSFPPPSRCWCLMSSSWWSEVLRIGRRRRSSATSRPSPVAVERYPPRRRG